MFRVYKIIIGLILSIVFVFSAVSANSEDSSGFLPFKVTLDTRVGGAVYRKDISIVSEESDWKGFYNNTVAGVELYNYEGLEGGIHFGFSFTSKSYEDLFVTGPDSVQSNEMDFKGYIAHADVGWGLLNSTYSCNFLMGYGYKRFNFSRRVSGLSAEENVNIHFINFGVRDRLYLNEKMNLTGYGYAGHIFYAETDNELLGKLDSDGGFILNIGGNFEWEYIKSWFFIIGVFYDFQLIKGTTKDVTVGVIEWPDNGLHTFGITIGMAYKF